MAHAGQVIDGGHGFRLSLIRTGAETDGELLEMEASYAGTGGMPPLHLHPKQDEHFEVLDGSMLAVIAGVERRYERGDSIEVPAGTPHQMRALVPSRVRWEVRPALRTAEFFERLHGGEVGPDFFEEYSDEFRLTQGPEGG